MKTSTIDCLPWNDIATPAEDYNVRLVPDCGTVPVYWGKDCNGNFLCLIALAGDHRTLFLQEKVSVNGLSIDLQQTAEQNIQNLVLSLERKDNGDLFFILCNSLVNKLRRAIHSEMALLTVLHHLRRWQFFLSAANANLLSIQEYRGLFAELFFLKRLLGKFSDQKTAIDAWTGPDRIQQDFIFSGRAVEIKSLSGRDPGTVTISSENQLETIESHLYLACIVLDDAPKNPVARSLNEVVEEVAEILTDCDALAGFERKLAEMHYVPRPEYDAQKLLASSVHTYAVGADFPRLVRSGLPSGVVHVRYQIELDKLQRFACDLGKVFEGI